MSRLTHFDLKRRSLLGSLWYAATARDTGMTLYWRLRFWWAAGNS